MKPRPRVSPELADYVSHAIRSPLNGIKTWAGVLSNSIDAGDEQTMRRALRGILDGVDAQVRFLDDLLAEPQRHSGGGDGSKRHTPEDPMAQSTQPNEKDQDRNRTAEHPQRPEAEPETMEGPGGRREGKAEQDAKNKTTRRGER